MKVGDLVKFQTKSWVMRRDYANPGVVLEVRAARHNKSRRMRVMWSAGSITLEHGCYLEVVSESR